MAVQHDDFPVPSRRAAGVVDGVATEAASLSFSDKILVTISQGGRLSQWVSASSSTSS